MATIAPVSRRTTVQSALLAGAAALLPVAGRAQDDADASGAATLHPIVGAWMLTLDVSEPGVPPHLVIYHADGTYTDAGLGRGGGVGVWEAIDETSVATNVLFHTDDANGNPGLTRIRTVTQVDESGDAYTSDYTREVISTDGTTSGELGPGTGQAERITVEPRGEPVAAATPSS